jgi:hypothetical protein
LNWWTICLSFRVTPTTRHLAPFWLNILSKHTFSFNSIAGMCWCPVPTVQFCFALRIQMRGCSPSPFWSGSFWCLFLAAWFEVCVWSSRRNVFRPAVCCSIYVEINKPIDRVHVRPMETGTSTCFTHSEFVCGNEQIHVQNVTKSINVKCHCSWVETVR